MPNKVNAQDPVLSIESVSSVFAHDIATPLTTAQLNVNLLLEHIALLESMVETEKAENIPQHIRAAIKNAPRVIQNNLRKIQSSLQEYKHYLNACAATEKNPVDTTSTRPSDTAAGSETKLRILLVDDEPIHHDIATAVLGKYHELAHEYSGLAAIERCKHDDFDVILMDMQMPKLSGPHTVEKLRSQIPNSTQIFGLTSMPIEKCKSELIELGFDGFLEKPLKYAPFTQLLAQR